MLIFVCRDCLLVNYFVFFSSLLSLFKFILIPLVHRIPILELLLVVTAGSQILFCLYHNLKQILMFDLSTPVGMGKLSKPKYDKETMPWLAQWQIRSQPYDAIICSIGSNKNETAVARNNWENHSISLPNDNQLQWNTRRSLWVYTPMSSDSRVLYGTTNFNRPPPPVYFRIAHRFKWKMMPNALWFSYISTHLCNHSS